MGPAGVQELRRCIDKRVGFVGYAVSASKSPPGSDPAYDPFYKLCIEAGIPVLFFVGTTGLGAGLPGGGGVILDNCHPRHLDRVAAHYPELKIVAARPGWPWQTETHRRADAQAQHLVRAARLVAEISRRRSASTISRAG